MSVRYAPEFNFDLNGLRKRTIRTLDVPQAPTTDLAFWHRLTIKTNSLYIAGAAEMKAGSGEFRGTPEPMDKCHPILDYERFISSPKARKQEDVRRMLVSANSEDWVTWNAFAMVERLAPDIWWKHLTNLAGRENRNLVLPENWEETPSVDLWHTVPAPRDYEMASRARMRNSGVPAWVTRSHEELSVEGESEIDICLRNRVLTIFVEAKLRSDISLRTTYDPERNQIVRNIDCLIDSAQQTTPVFWMLVRDSGATRAYRQLMENYRRETDVLAQALPHRAPSQLARVAHSMSLILWRDFVSVVPKSAAGDELFNEVYRELLRRVS